MTYQSVKANLMLNPYLMYILAAGTILAANTTGISPHLILFMVTTAFIVNQFYYDQKTHANRFFISLPVSKQSIVQGRYIAIICVSLLYVLIQSVLSFAGMEGFHLNDLLTMISLQFMCIAIIVPLFYMIPSITIAIGTVMVMVFLGTFIVLDALVTILDVEGDIIFNDLGPGLGLLVEKYFPYQPYLMFLLTSIVLLYLSIKISTYVFRVRNY